MYSRTFRFFVLSVTLASLALAASHIAEQKVLAQERGFTATLGPGQSIQAAIEGPMNS